MSFKSVLFGNLVASARKQAPKVPGAVVRDAARPLMAADSKAMTAVVARSRAALTRKSSKLLAGARIAFRAGGRTSGAAQLTCYDAAAKGYESAIQAATTTKSALAIGKEASSRGFWANPATYGWFACLKPNNALQNAGNAGYHRALQLATSKEQAALVLSAAKNSYMTSGMKLAIEARPLSFTLPSEPNLFKRASLVLKTAYLDFSLIDSLFPRGLL